MTVPVLTVLRLFCDCADCDVTVTVTVTVNCACNCAETVLTVTCAVTFQPDGQIATTDAEYIDRVAKYVTFWQKYFNLLSLCLVNCTARRPRPLSGTYRCPTPPFPLPHPCKRRILPVP